jgi:hypothetical protein
LGVYAKISKLFFAGKWHGGHTGFMPWLDGVPSYW